MGIAFSAQCRPLAFIDSCVWKGHGAGGAGLSWGYSRGGNCGLLNLFTCLQTRTRDCTTKILDVNRESEHIQLTLTLPALLLYNDTDEILLCCTRPLLWLFSRLHGTSSLEQPHSRTPVFRRIQLRMGRCPIKPHTNSVHRPP